MARQVNAVKSLLFLPLFTALAVVGGFAGLAKVNPQLGDRNLVSGYFSVKDTPMFDTSLTRPDPGEDQIPLNAEGDEDWVAENYGYAQSGAREIAAFHRLHGGLDRIPVAVLLEVLTAQAEQDEIPIPRNPLDLIHYFPQLRITELNRKSEHLLRTPDHRVLNFAAYANLAEDGIDPNEALTEWNHPLQEYASHNLTFTTGAKYIPKALRSDHNPIKDYIDHSVDDPETAKVLHFVFASPLVGWQTFKAVNFLIGLKNAGKSVTLNSLDGVFGSYSMTVPPIKLLPHFEDWLVKELFAYHGIRILRIDELNAQSYFNEPLIKRITGRDGLANPFVTSPIRHFVPQVKIFCDSNAPLRPQIGTESSISDRLYYFPYGKVVPVEKRDPHFEAKLKNQENLDTYFSWLIDTYLLDVIKGRLS